MTEEKIARINELYKKSKAEGLTEEEAKAKANESSLSLQIEEQYDRNVEAGKVISQDPVYMENYMIKENSIVKVVISKGTDIKKVPKVVGLEYEEAKDKIEEQSLNVEKVEESSDKVEAGYVIRQDPEQDSEANSGETVKVYVSTGAKMITMENVVGSKEADAKTKLTKKGFEVDVVYEEDTSKDDGIVLKQSIDIGKEVKDGSKVTLTVNKIQALKEGTININLKSLLKYDTKADETANITDPTVSVSTVNIQVTADGDNVYKEDVRKDTENINITVSGKGTIEVKVFINGIRKVTKQFNLNVDKPVLNID